MELNTQLKETKNQILQYFELPDGELSKTYGAGKWNIRQILIHLTDAEAVLLERIKRTIANPGQTIMAFDQDKWAQELEYDHFPLTLAAALFAANRDAIIYLAERFYLEKGDHTYQHSEVGERSLKDEFDKVLWHCEDHIKQIEKALKS
jgi:uncharacterized damage-inducible protein DinB